MSVINDSGTLDTDPTVTLTVHDRDGEALGGFELLSIEQRHDYSKFPDVTNVGDALSLEIERAPDSSFDISVVANPGVDVAAVDFSIVDENGIDNFELGSGLSGWSVTTNPASSAVDKSIAVSAIGAANFADAIQAGSETVLASYSSSAQSDILLTGGKLGSQLQSEVHASARMTTTDATGQASFDFSSENTVFVDTVHSYSNAFPNLHVSAQDALTLMRMQLGLEASTPEQLIAADFNRDGVLDIWDVKGILEYSVALPGSDEAEWVLIDSDNDHSSITENNVNYDSGIELHDISTDTSVFATAILIGDVDNSYSANLSGTTDPSTDPDNSTNPDNSTGSTTGYVIDGYIRNAFLFRDEDGDGVVDAGEASIYEREWSIHTRRK